jgi:hypothetical protein
MVLFLLQVSTARCHSCILSVEHDPDFLKRAHRGARNRRSTSYIPHSIVDCPQLVLGHDAICGYAERTLECTLSCQASRDRGKVPR